MIEKGLISGTVGPAVGNAIFDATGARLYRMLMTSERVLEVIKKILWIPPAHSAILIRQS